LRGLVTLEAQVSSFSTQEQVWDGIEEIKFASAFVWRKDPRMAPYFIAENSFALDVLYTMRALPQRAFDTVHGIPCKRRGEDEYTACGERRLERERQVSL
jgi:hypothetical protein